MAHEMYVHDGCCIRDLLLTAINDLEKLSVWIALRSPPAEEGNNTGVRKERVQWWARILLLMLLLVHAMP